MSSSTSKTHPSLLERIRDRDDQRSWDEFARKYRPLIVGFARRVGLSDWDADDVSQAVLLDLSSSLAHFRYDTERGRFRDYLARIVRHRVYRFLRTGADLAQRDGIDPLTVAADDTLDAAWEAEWVLHHYRQALVIAKRDFDGRTVAIFMQLMAGVSPAAVAEAEGVSEATVYKAKERVRDRLRDLIQDRIRLEDEDV